VEDCSFVTCENNPLNPEQLIYNKKITLDKYNTLQNNLIQQRQSFSRKPNCRPVVLLKANILDQLYSSVTACTKCYGLSHQKNRVHLAMAIKSHLQMITLHFQRTEHV